MLDRIGHEPNKFTLHHVNELYFEKQILKNTWKNTKNFATLVTSSAIFRDTNTREINFYASHKNIYEHVFTHRPSINP